MSTSVTWFKMFLSFTPLINAIPSQNVGDGVKAAMNYFKTGNEADDLEEMTRVIYDTLKDSIDQAFTDCAETSEMKRNAVNARWAKQNTKDAPAYTRNKGDTDVYTCMQCNTDDTEEKRKEEKEKKRTDDIDKGQRICTEPSKLDSMQQPSPTVFQLILKDGNTYGINEDEVDYYAAKHPAVDIEQAFRNMTGWLDANPGKRKTRQGMNAFITNWLTNAQNCGGKICVRRQQPDKNQYDTRPQPQGNPFADVPD